MSNATMTHTAPFSSYTRAIAALPPEAYLGSLLWFSISAADVNLDLARHELHKAGLRTDTLRKNLRPIDAFRKATREMGHKFAVVDGVRSELLVRSVGEDEEQAHRHLILERAVVKAGKKRRVFYEKVGEVVFTRGEKKHGEYSGYAVLATRTTSYSAPLTEDEEAWLSTRLATFEQRFAHLLTHMDSHAVRTFVREYIALLSGTLVKESGGLYFVAQQHAEEIARLGVWVNGIGSQFHSLPLLNLVEQRQMLMEALEDETLKEVERLTGEVAKILADPDRTIAERTFDSYGIRAAELSAKVNEYNLMLGARADRASIEISMYTQQVMALAGRIRSTKGTTHG